MVLIKGSAGHSDFTVENLKDNRILDLAKKIEVFEDKEINGNFPAKRTAAVIIKFSDGEEIVHRVDIPRGMPENPLSKNELVEKFKALTLDILGSEKADKIAESILSSENNERVYYYLRN